MAKYAPIVEDTRRIRRLISKQFGHDLERYVKYRRSRPDASEPAPKGKAKRGGGRRGR